MSQEKRTCKTCSKDFSVVKSVGRPRQNCSECSPSRAKGGTKKAKAKKATKK